MLMVIVKHHVKKGKWALLFSFLLLSGIFKSQAFIRSSDEKTFDSVMLLREGKTIEINTLNFKNFSFKSGDKILYKDRLIDFFTSQDTLIFFDKVKDIEEIHFNKENLNEKREKFVKSKELRYHAQDIFPNNLTATYIHINTSKKTFVKSIVFFPELSFFPHDIKGNIDIQILPNINGFPDIDNPILSFQRDISETVNKRWEIVLPRIIKYPDNGFFVTFYYLSNDKRKTAALKMDNYTFIYFYYPQTKEWKKASFNGYFYKLKILQ